MAVVKARDQDVTLLARLLRAEAEGEGELGMLLVGNVGINRIRANCSDFKGIRTYHKWFTKRMLLRLFNMVTFINAPEKEISV